MLFNKENGILKFMKEAASMEEVHIIFRLMRESCCYIYKEQETAMSFVSCGFCSGARMRVTTCNRHDLCVRTQTNTHTKHTHKQSVDIGARASKRALNS